MTHLMLWITSLANWQFVVATALMVAALLWIRKKRSLIVPFWATLAGTSLTVELTKILVQRPRPIGAEFLETSFSFPSGHSAIAVALYGSLAMMAINTTKNRGARTFAVTFSLLLIALIGSSRVILGVHFPTDVAGGYLVGAAWLGLTSKLAKGR